MTLEEDFYDFMKFCGDKGIICRFFSMVDKSWSRLNLLGDYFRKELFFDNISYPRSNPVSFNQLTREIGLPAENIVLVDDSPLALWSAKTAGLKTAFMSNNVFTGSDYKPYREVIDFRVNSFNELKKIF
jgi:FMN phosphatase YigB (HAD superfamily)